MSNFSNFQAVYDDLCDAVIGSRHQFYADHLRNFFESIDATPFVFEIADDLEDPVDLKAFLKAAEESQGSFAGSGVLKWPTSREGRLGMSDDPDFEYLIVQNGHSIPRVRPRRCSYESHGFFRRIQDDLRRHARLFQPQQNAAKAALSPSVGTSSRSASDTALSRTSRTTYLCSAGK